MIILLFALLSNPMSPCDSALARITSAQTFAEAKERAREECASLNNVCIDWVFAHRLYALSTQQEIEWLKLWREIKEQRK